MQKIESLPEKSKLKKPELKMPERWIRLKEACEMKGIAYNSLSRPRDAWRQPNCGKEDGIVNGRKAWRPDTVRKWILMDDNMLKSLYKKRIRDLAVRNSRRMKGANRSE